MQENLFYMQGICRKCEHKEILCNINKLTASLCSHSRNVQKLYATYTNIYVAYSTFLSEKNHFICKLYVMICEHKESLCNIKILYASLCSHNRFP
jgi:20S proteasome alpha/beta subunit